MALFEILWMVAWVVIMLTLCAFGAQRLVILWFYWRNRHRVPVLPDRFDELPPVAIQLPVFNEKHVAARLIRAVGKIDYPRDRLYIQVLDDSTDATVDICRAEVARLVDQGLNVDHLHRETRSGYKAGALEKGMSLVSADFLFILDADFVPDRRILQELVHHFTDPQVGMVQARWGHLNRRASLLTELQAIFLDGHFVVEQTARNRAGYYFNFNGTAGMWRRRAIEEAGGWQHDTITEDLDLSYRAQLAGWRFVFLKDVVVSAELPYEIGGFKSQQHRWTKGSIETCLKLLPRIWREAPDLGTRVMATAHLAANFCYLPLLALLVGGYPMALRKDPGIFRLMLLDAPFFLFATGSVLVFYLVSQLVQQERSVFQTMLLLPVLLALGAGMAINNSRGVIMALLGKKSPFVRTPKSGGQTANDKHAGSGIFQSPVMTGAYGVVKSGWVFVEAFLSLYFTVLAINAISQGHWGLAALMFLFASGFAMVSWAGRLLSLRWQGRAGFKRSKKSESAKGRDSMETNGEGGTQSKLGAIP